MKVKLIKSGFVLIISVILLVTSCGKQNVTSSTTPASAPSGITPVSATTQNASFIANLTGSEVALPVNTKAQGQAVFYLTNNNTALDYKLTITNVENVTMAQIHLGSKYQEGTIIVWLFPGIPEPQEIPGISSGTLATGTIYAANLRGLLEGHSMKTFIEQIISSNTYVDVSTTQNPYGEIRGQIYQFSQLGNQTATQINEFDGTIAGIQGNNLVLTTGAAHRTVTLNTDAWIQLADGSRGTTGDLKTGDKVEVYLLPSTQNAYKVEMWPAGLGPGFLTVVVRGTITYFSGSALVIHPDIGADAGLELSGITRIVLQNGTNGNRLDLKTGIRAEVYYDFATKTALKIELE